jgi:hypothetical protein
MLIRDIVTVPYGPPSSIHAADMLSPPLWAEIMSAEESRNFLLRNRCPPGSAVSGSFVETVSTGLTTQMIEHAQEHCSVKK